VFYKQTVYMETTVLIKTPEQYSSGVLSSGQKTKALDNPRALNNTLTGRSDWI
jgi:hypothetical protein